MNNILIVLFAIVNSSPLPYTYSYENLMSYPSISIVSYSHTPSYHIFIDTLKVLHLKQIESPCTDHTQNVEFSSFYSVIQTSSYYYICASNLNVYQASIIGSNLQITVIPNTQFSSIRTASRLICHYDSQNNIIILSFINTSFVGYLKNGGSMITLFDIDNEIYGGDFFQDSNENFYLRYLTKSKIDKSFSFSKVTSYDQFQKNNFKKDVLLFDNVFIYDTVELSLSGQNSMFYMISYNTKYFTFYVFDNNANIIIDYGYSFFNIGTNLKYKNIKFVPHSYFIYMELDINEESYIGVADIYNKVIISYGQSDSSFLNYYEENSNSYIAAVLNDRVLNVINIINNDSTLKCSFHFLLSTNYNQCTQCSSITNYYLYNSIYCIDTCPHKTDTANKQCTLCPSSHFYDAETNECTTTCTFPQGGSSLKTCVDCSSKYLYEGRCLDHCYNKIYDANTRQCISCESQNKYYCGDDMKCCEKCPDGYYDFSSSHICEKCPYTSYCIDEKGKCFDNSQGTYMIDSTTGKCISQCEEGEEEVSHQCIKCSDNTDGRIYYDSGTKKCVSGCSEYSEIKEGGICFNCKENSLNYEDSKCVPQCSKKGSIVLVDKGNSCYQCKEGGKYFYNNECIEKCINTIPDDDNVCSTCESINSLKPFFYEEKCYEKCPSLTSPNSNKICIKCSDENKLYLDIKDHEACVSSCPYCKDDSRCYLCNKCQNIDITLSKIYNRKEDKCVDECNFNEVVIDNECVNCYEDHNHYVSYNNECVEKCPDRYEEDEYHKCIECQIVYDNKCISKCPSFYGVEDKTCIRCRNFYHIDKEECVTQCDDNDVINEVTMICYYKKKEIHCESDCFNHGRCDENNNQCICDDEYEGTFCQLKKDNTNQIKILSKKKTILSNEINEFYFTTDIEYDEYEITWSYGDYNESIRSKFINGFNEESFKVDKNTFHSGINIISVSFSSFTSQLMIEIKGIDISSFDYILKYLNDEDIAIAMSTIVYIKVYSNENNLYRYQFCYVDPSTSMILPLEHTSEDTGVFSDHIPYTKTIKVKIYDDIGQYDYIDIPVNVKEDDFYPIDIIKDDSISQNEKLKELNSYLSSNHTITNKDDLGIINTLVESIIDDLFTNPYTFHSLDEVTNTLSLISLSSSSISSQLIKKVSSYINSLDSSVSTDSLMTLYSTLSTLLDNFNDVSIEEGTEVSSSIKQSINNFNAYVSRTISNGETILVATPNFHSFINRPSKHQSSLSLYNTTSKSIISNVIMNTTSSCDNQAMYCVNNSDYIDLNNYLELISDTSIDDISFIVTTIANTNTSQTSISKSVITVLYDISSNTSYTNLTLKYRIEIESEVDLSKNNITYNSSCYDITLSSQCTTYFNYITNHIICKCSGTGEITTINDKNITDSNKSNQYNLESLYSLINPLSMCIISTVIVLISVFSVFLLIIDYNDDKFMLYLRKTNDNKIFFNNFLDMRGLFDTNIFSFVWYVVCYEYTLLSMFNLYGYNQPRFIRFTIEVLTMMISLSASLYPYYHDNFDYMEDVINKRDIETEEWNIKNLPAKIFDIVIGLVYSIIATIIIQIIMVFFSCLLSHDKVVINVWKERYSDIEKYIKKYIVFDDKCIDVFQKKKVAKRLEAICALVNLYNEVNRKDNDIYLDTESNDINSSKKKKKHRYYIERSCILSLNIKIDEDEITDEMIKLNSSDVSLTVNRHRASKTILSTSMIRSKIKTYEMIHLISLSIYNINDNQILIKSFRKEVKNIIMTFISTVFIVAFFVFIFIFIAVLLKDIYYRYHFYIVKVCLFPSILQLLFVRLLTAYGIQFAFSLLLFLFNSKEKGFLMKFVFSHIIPEEVKYMYMMREILGRYKRSLEKLQIKYLIED